MNAIRSTVSAILGLAVGAVYAPTVFAQEDALEEIVVTATRISEGVNRIPLAVTAQTQRNLDQQGIATIADLQALVPSLRLTGLREGSGIATVAIRSVVQAAGTSATTGFYLDETSMQKRSSTGFGSLNGTPIPPLFDLERVEVLRGPQGTLFGGGSEGGTIRYLQPQPGLKEYTSYGRAQVLTTRGGDPSYEAGLAVGGPIIEDKLGFRASVFGRNSGGWTDLTDFRNGLVYDQNANHGDLRMGRFALAWVPSQDTRLTLSYFTSMDKTHHISSTYNLDLGQVTVPSLCYDVNALTALPLRSFPRSNPGAFAVGPTCNGRAGQAGVVITPGYVLGPLDLQRDQSLALGPASARTDLNVASADFQWNLARDMELRSITSYVDDLSRGTSPQNFHQGQVSYAVAGGATLVLPDGLGTIRVPSGVGFNPNVTSTPNGLGLGAYLQTNSRNSRNTISQEVRLSASGERRLSYVVGAYFAETNDSIRQLAESSDLGFVQMAALNTQQRYGVPFQGFFADIQEQTKDTETAAFADATFRFTDHLRASAGVRLSYVTTSFRQTNFGPVGYSTQPSLQDGSLVTGRISDSPITPKASLQYFITPDNLVYLTAAKGFRAGGVNPVFTSAGQTVLFLQYGLTPAILPKTFESDSVWNYELGGKFRLWDGRAQINTAVYQLDWDNIQTSQFIGGDTIVFNVPKARSKGAEIELQLRPLRSVLFNASAAYNTAEYRKGLSIPPGPGRTLPFNIGQAGQAFVQPKWTADAGVRYDLYTGDLVNAYTRVDYRWTKGYFNAAPGTVNYTPDSSEVPAQRSINLRFGFEHKGLDVNLFAVNLTDEHDGSKTGGRSGCTNLDCSTFTSYAIARTITAPVPRQIGVQVTYRQ